MFRLSNKKVHLTYKGHLDNQNLIAHLTTVCGELQWWSLVHELGGKEVAYNHTHVALAALKKIDTRNERFFDFEDVHPNIKVLSTADAVRNAWLYHEKDPVALWRSDTSPINGEGFYWGIIHADSLLDAVKHSGVQVKTVQDIRALRNDKGREQVIPEIENEGKWVIEPPSYWNTLYVHGKTGVGKTRWALSQFEKPLLVSHMEGLKQFSPMKHDGIVFDDMCFNDHTKFDVGMLINLFDWEIPRTIKVMYGSVEIPAHTKKILTSNLPFKQCMLQMSEMQFAALKRRVYIFECNVPMFVRHINHGRAVDDDSIPEKEMCSSIGTLSDYCAELCNSSSNNCNTGRTCPSAMVSTFNPGRTLNSPITIDDMEMEAYQQGKLFNFDDINSQSNFFDMSGNDSGDEDEYK